MRALARPAAHRLVELKDRVIAARLTFMAGSIAYYGLVSIISAGLLSVLLANTFAGETLQMLLFELTGPYLTATAQESLTTALEDIRGGIAFSIAGSVTFLWGVSKVFRALEVAFAEIYGLERRSLFERSYATALVAFATMTLGVIVVVLSGTLASMLPLGVADTLTPVWLAAGLTLLFLPTFYVFAGSRLSTLQALPGATIAGVCWSAFQVGFEFYVTNFANYYTYGALGTILLFLTWLYYSGFIVLLGAVVNSMLFPGTVAQPGRLLDRSHPSRRQ